MAMLFAGHLAEGEARAVTAPSLVSPTASTSGDGGMRSRGTRHALQPGMSMKVSCLVSFFSLITVSAAAQERQRESPLPNVVADSPSGRFGLKGQIAVSSDTGLSISNTSVSGIDGSSTTLLLRPAVDYFIVDNVSIGGFLGIEYTSAPGGSSTAISVGPRVGYDIPLSDRFSLWPKLGFSFASTSQKTDDVAGIPGEDESSTSVQLNLFAPFMFHPVEHFFIGFGPAFDVDLSGDSKATTIAARLTLGGWL
jgi:outer membrane protein with beta-barrel domain